MDHELSIIFFDIRKKARQMIILYTTAILMGFLCRKNRICTVYILGVMYLMAAFCTQSADYFNYEFEYNLIASDMDSSSISRYLGYGPFVKIFATAGFDFVQYRRVFYLLVLAILFWGIHNLTKNVNFVLSMYLIFPFCIDAVQMKSILAFTIELFGISILLKADENESIRRRFILFLIISLLASLIHLTAAFYIIAGMAYLFWHKGRKILKNVFILSLAGFLFACSGGLPMIANILNHFGILGDMEYMSNWLEIKVRLGFVIELFWVLMLIYCFGRGEIQKSRVCAIEENARKFSSTVFLTLPVLIFNFEYLRLLRPYMIIGYIIFADHFQRRETKSAIIRNLSFSAMMIFVCLLEILPVYEGTLGALLNNNALLGFSM